MFCVCARLMQLCCKSGFFYKEGSFSKIAEGRHKNLIPTHVLGHFHEHSGGYQHYHCCSFFGFTSRSSDHDPSKDGLFVINYHCLISATLINITQNCYFLLVFLVTK